MEEAFRGHRVADKKTCQAHKHKRDGACWLPENRLAPAELSALYRRARVFADASWSARGLYRLARAGASGAALVAPSSGYARDVWAGRAVLADPGSAESIASALRHAWERADALGPAVAAETARACDPLASLKETLAAYQAAATAAAATAPL